MSNISKQNLKYIEWTVKVPSSESATLCSEAIYLEECKSHLEYFSGTANDTYPHLTFKSTRELKLPLAVTVFVVKDSQFLGYVTDSVQTEIKIIWIYKKSTVLTSCSLIFHVIFHTDCLKEDKCIQTDSYMNGNFCMHSLAEDFSKLLPTGLDHDLEMKCGGDSIKVHKIVLSTRSDVFKAMLQNDMVEGQTGVVEIKDMDVTYFQDFVKYLYTDCMPELNFDKAKALYEAGDKYAVKSLVVRCADYFLDNLSPDNAFECYGLADAHSDQKLMDIIKFYLLDKQIFLQKEIWMPFLENFPKLALEVYRLSYEKKGRRVKPVCSKLFQF